MEIKTASEYLEEIGWGKYNRNVFFQCGFVILILAWVTDMLWSTNIAYILDGSKEDFLLSGLEMGILGSCFPVGLMIGSNLFGIISDNYSRMHAFKSTALITAIFSLLLALSYNLIIIGLSLVFLGLGIGG